MWRQQFGQIYITFMLSDISSRKGVKMDFFVLLSLFWCYIWQPDNQIGWATLLSFTSIFPTNPRINSWIFCEKILRIFGVENLSFFLSQPSFIFFCFILIHISHNLWETKDETKFLWLCTWISSKKGCIELWETF